MRSLIRFFGPLLLLTSTVHAADEPNILFVTVDDMNCDSVGVYGCELDGTTPHMDRFAESGLRFLHAHVQVGNCMPSRNVMWTGRHPHNNRVEGFYQVKNPDYPHLADLMKQAGYFTTIRGKHTHSTPYNPYAWDAVLDIDNGRKNLKNPTSYYESTKQAINQSGDRKFCLQINISDPHKPFYTGPNDPHQPSRIFTPAEVPIPGFLFDHPQVRKELAQYYSSVRRADDCFGEILRALDESGERDNTIVLFLSDHGMPMPFAKTQLYYHSTHTPLMIRWPGMTQPNSVDETHVVSAIDLLPTLLDMIDAKHPDGLEGHSLVPLIKGRTQSNREFAFGVYNENSGGARQPMRSVVSKKFGYIFNPWSDGNREVKGATVGTASFKAMKSSTDPIVLARFRTFVYREREEFFDYESDPNGLNNLIDDQKYADELARHRKAMEQFMADSNDHMLDTFRNRDDENVVQAYMTKVENESAQRRQGRRKNQPRRGRKFIQLETQPNAPFTVRVVHKLPRRLGEQLVHVTLKTGKNPKRVDRKVVRISGSGEETVTFDVTADNLVDGVVSYAAFVGKDYGSNLQHITTKPIEVK
ncbi:MAG: sulfatase [Planctomycetaceae bacterium]